MRESEWVAKDSQLNALATATKAALAGRRHIVTAIIASYSGPKTGVVTLYHGATPVLEHYIINADVVEIPDGLRNPAANQAVSAELEAGGSGVTGKVNLLGYTGGG